MKLIFVNRFFHPDHSATSQLLSDLAFALAGQGHEVTVITSRLRYDDPAVQLPARDIVNGVRVERVRTTGFGRRTLAGRAIDYLSFYGAAALALVAAARRGSVIIAKTDPPMLSVMAAPIAMVRGAVLVNWHQDVFPEVMQALGLMRGRGGRLLLGLLRWLRNRSLRRAAVNIVLGPAMARHLIGEGAPPEKIRIMPNWADGALIRPVARADNALRRSWGFEGQFVVGYSGNLGRAHEIDTFVDAIALVQAKVAAQTGDDAKLAGRIRWLFIGGGAQMQAMREAVAARGLGDVRFEDYQPRERLAESLSLPDLHLISLRPDMEGLIVPSKYYGIAAAGRPALMIGAADGDIGNLLGETGTGRVIAEGDAAGLADAVMAFARDPEKTARQGEAARALFEARFALPHALERWRAMLASLPGADKGSVG
ncbi:MAG: glycosyltransferase family 4 protein [Erythrobacter sp.]